MPPQSPAERRSQSRTPNGRPGRGRSVQNMRHFDQQENRTSQRLENHVQGAQGTDSQPLQSLRDKTAAALREIEKLRGKIQRHEDLQHSYRQAIEDKVLECRDLKERMATLETQLGSASQQPGWSLSNLLPRSRDAQRLENDEIARLQTELAQYKEAFSSLQAEFVQELDGLKRKTTITAPKISDSEIQGDWKAIGCLIRQFVLKYLGKPLDRPTVHKLRQDENFGWLPELPKTSRLVLFRHVVLESWVWHFLCFKVFDSQSKIWAGKAGTDFFATCDKIRGLLFRGEEPPNKQSIKKEEFHDWRVRSAHIISESICSTHDQYAATEITAATMIDALEVFMPSTMSHAQVNDMRLDALAIVRRAAELDNIFRLSRADFHVFITRVKLPLVRPPSFGFKFDTETMERISSIPDCGPASDDPVVDLAVSPGIFKAGNADGENYDSERVLVKLQALCNLQAALDFFDVPLQTSSLQEETETEEDSTIIKQENTEGEDEVELLRPKPETSD